MKTAQTIEEAKEAQGSLPSANATQKKRGGHPNAIAALKPYCWKPGQSGNPGGKPKHDIAKEIAQAIFENDSEQIYQAFAKALRQGNAYSFDVLANRAFGKMKETVVHEGLGELSEKINKLRKRKRGDSTASNAG